MRKNKNDVNLYAAFVEGKTTKEETKAVLWAIAINPRLIRCLNLAATYRIGQR